MKGGRLLILVLVSFTSSLYCYPPPCKNCKTGVLYEDQQCINKCPDPQDPNTNPCYMKFRDTIFTLSFYSFSDISAKAFSSFKTPNGLPFSDSSKFSPLPTLNQGFYFSSNSSLINEISRVLSPDFTFHLSAIFKQPGDVFRIKTPSLTYFYLRVDEEFLVVEILLQYFQITEIKNFSIPFNKNGWDIFSMKIYHTSNNCLKLNFTTLENFKTFLECDYEFQVPDQPYTMIFGSQTNSSFKGFLLDAMWGNSKNEYFYKPEFKMTCLCDFNEYCSSGNCIPCPNNCSDWPWCSRESCTFCYSAACKNCSNYYFSGCTKCIDINKTAPNCECGPYCETCKSTFECTSCVDQYKLEGSICTLTPYKKGESSLVFNYEFRTFEQFKGDVFQSGSNNSTYFPLNHELDDPLVLDKRGAVLSPQSYFISSPQVNLFLNYTFTVSTWTFAEVIINFGNFVYNSKGKCKIDLMSTENTETFHGFMKNPQLTEWVFQSLSIVFEKSETTLRMVMDNRVTSLFSIYGFVYVSSGNSVRIYSNEYAMIYYLMIDQVNIERTRNFNDYGPGIPCFYWAYWNDFIKGCYYCQNSHNSICNTFGTDSICKDLNCSSCNYYNETCTQDRNAICHQGLNFTSGKCCYIDCLDCFEKSKFACFQCIPSKKLLGHTCVETCPSGFDLNKSVCLSKVGPVVDIQFDKILLEFNDSSVYKNLVQAGNESVEYPFVNPTHPLPAYQRGFYFREKSFVSVSDILMSYNFSIFFMIRLQASGVIFQKGGISVCLIDSYLYIEDKVKGFNHSFNAPNFNTWLSMIINFSGSISLFTYVKVFSYPNKTDSTYNPSIIFETSSSPIILGSSSNSFQGFIWQFRLYNYNFKILSEANLCIGLTNSTCLQPCEIEEFFKNGSCDSCKSCPLGCIRSEDCFLCQDPLCKSCIDFELGCDSCKENSVLIDKRCECLEGYYLDQATLTCSHCKNNCKACKSENDCECFEDSHQEKLSCVCDTGFWANSTSSCSKCHEWCKECFGDQKSQCKNCSNYLIGSFCVNACPFDYLETGHFCDDQGGGLSLSFRFDRLDGKFESKGINLLCGKSGKFYPELELYDPWPAYQRGLYFNDENFCRAPYANKEYLLGIEFSLQVWFNRFSDKGTLINVQGSGSSFLVSFEKDLIRLEIVLDSKFEFSYLNSLPQVWTLLTINVKYQDSCSIALAVNQDLSSYSELEKLPFNNSDSSPIYLGSEKNKGNSFSGFIYEMSLYKSPQNPSKSQSFSESCGFFPANENCLPFCNISTYPEERNCFNCHKKCLKGCRNLNSCNLCHDLNCFECSDYSAGTCRKCREGFREFQGICVEICKSFEYFEEQEVKCKSCPMLCLTCLSDEICLNCSDSAELNSFNKCACIKGFSGQESCFRNYFNASISVSSSNIVTLHFSEVLESELSADILNLTVDSVSVQFKLKKVDSSSYKIILTEKNIEKDSRIILIFTAQVISIENSLLSTEFLTALLFSHYSSSDSETILTIQSTTSKGMIALSALSFGLGFATFDIKRFFDLRNTAEIFSVIVLSEIELDDYLRAFLNEIHKTSTLPSFFNAFIDSSQGVRLPSRYRNYGYETNFIILNAGMYFMTFSGLFVVYFPFKVFHLVKPNKLTEIVMNYLEFDAFLKLWVQGFLEVSVCAILGIWFSEFANPMQVIDVILCFFVLVLNFVGIVVLALLIQRHSTIKDEEQMKDFLKRYKNFFGEFKPGSTCFYYFIFIIRREFILVSLFIQEEWLELSIQLILSSAVLFYLIFSRIHLDLNILSLRIISEVCTLGFFWVIVLKFYFQVKISSFAIIGVAGLALLANPLFGIVKMVIKARAWVRSRRQKIMTTSVIPVDHVIETNKSKNDAKFITSTRN